MRSARVVLVKNGKSFITFGTFDTSGNCPKVCNLRSNDDDDQIIMMCAQLGKWCLLLLYICFIVRIHTRNRPESRVWNQLECSKCSDKWVTGQIWWSEASTENIYELMMNLPLCYYQCVQHKCAQLIVIISWFHGCSMRWIEILSLLFFSLKQNCFVIFDSPLPIGCLPIVVGMRASLSSDTQKHDTTTKEEVLTH